MFVEIFSYKLYSEAFFTVDWSSALEKVSYSLIEYGTTFANVSLKTYALISNYAYGICQVHSYVICQLLLTSTQKDCCNCQQTLNNFMTDKNS